MIRSAKATAKNVLDKIGIAATSLCAIHCLLLPFLLPVLPMMGASFIAQESFEDSVLALTMGLGVIALYSGYKRYHNRLFPFLFFAFGGLIYSQKDGFGVDIEPYLVMLGASLVVLAHVSNMKLCRRCTDC